MRCNVLIRCARRNLVNTFICCSIITWSWSLEQHHEIKMWSFFWCFRIRVATPLLLQWVKRNITLWNNLQRTVFLFILALRDVILFSIYSKIKVTYSCAKCGHELSLEMSQLLWGVSQLVNTTLGCHSYSFSGLVRWSKQAGLWSFSRAAQQTSGCRLHLTSPETLEQWKEALESVWRGRSVTAAQTVPEQTSPECLRVTVWVKHR